MDIQIGSAVLSKAGRDKGRFMAVIEMRDGYAWIADGRLRRIEKPKQKNIRHLGITGTVFTKDQMASNKALRNALRGRFEGCERDEEV